MIRNAAARNGQCSLLLAGGSTPRATYESLAARHRELPWAQVHFFWGDERVVAPDDHRSNARMAREALIDRVRCPPANVHPIPAGLLSTEAAARRYEDTLRAHFPGELPLFDLVLLGLGEDAHTASIFPGSPALVESERWVMAVLTPAEPPLRITVTMRALTAAAQLFVLVSGAGKAEALRRALDPASELSRYPGAALRLAGERVVWWADRAAAPGSGA